MPDDTTVRPLSEEELEVWRRWAAGDLVPRDAAAVTQFVESYQHQVAQRFIDTIAQRDALIEELRARVKELEDRVTSWEQDALRGSTGLAAWDWG